MGAYRCSSWSTTVWMLPYPDPTSCNNYRPIYMRGVAHELPLCSVSAGSQPTCPSTWMDMNGSMMTPPVIPPPVHGTLPMMAGPPPPLPPPPPYYSQGMPMPSMTIWKYTGPDQYMYRQSTAQPYPLNAPYPAAANGTNVPDEMPVPSKPAPRKKPSPVGSNVPSKKTGVVPSATPGRDVSTCPLGNARIASMYDPWNGGFKINVFGNSGGVQGDAPFEGDWEDQEKKSTGEKE